METLAGELLTKGGERETARHVWRRMYEQAEGAMRDNAAVHLQQLAALDNADALSGLVSAFARRFGRRPERLAELAMLGRADLPLVDPSGTPFEYDPTTGTVSIAARSRLAVR
jgi:hypothetical protein